MNLQFYLEKLKNSDEFKKFKKENPKAYLCSCFFIIDEENKKKPDNKQHLDFYVPSNKKMFSFQLEDEGKKNELEFKGDKAPEQISLDIDFDISDIGKIIIKRMKQDKINNIIKKIIFSFQRVDEKDFIIATVFISGYGLIKADIDISKMELTSFEKKSFFDMIKVVKKE